MAWLEQKSGVVGEKKKELIKNNQSFLFYLFPQGNKCKSSIF